MLVCGRQFKKLSPQPSSYALACQIGFGMLMRHALEAIFTSITTEIGIEVGDRSVFKRLNALKGQTIPAYDAQKESILFQALSLTNEIAHPHITSDKDNFFRTMYEFYNSYFRELITSQIASAESLSSRVLSKYATSESGAKIRILTSDYLLALKKTDGRI